MTLREAPFEDDRYEAVKHSLRGTPMGRRIVIEEPCEHGRYGSHYLPHEDHQGPHVLQNRYGPDCPHCPGGTRRTLTEGEYVLIEKVDGEWPDDAVHKMASAWLASKHQHLGGQLIDGLDALAGGGE